MHETSHSSSVHAPIHVAIHSSIHHPLVHHPSSNSFVQTGTWSTHSLVSLTNHPSSHQPSLCQFCSVVLLVRAAFYTFSCSNSKTGSISDSSQCVGYKTARYLIIVHRTLPVGSFPPLCGNKLKNSAIVVDALLGNKEILVQRLYETLNWFYTEII